MSQNDLDVSFAECGDGRCPLNVRICGLMDEDSSTSKKPPIEKRERMQRW